MPRQVPSPAAIRFPVAPRDVPAEKAARRLHLTLAEFQRVLPELLGRGFPTPDATTGHYDLVAIDAWMDSRHRINQSTAAPLTGSKAPRNAQEVFGARVARLHGR